MKNYFLAIILLLTLSACADVEPIQNCLHSDVYGFWSGIWHGLIVVFSFIGSLIWDDVAVYAVNNNGGWYDFGFLLGAGGFVLSPDITIKYKRKK